MIYLPLLVVIRLPISLHQDFLEFPQNLATTDNGILSTDRVAVGSCC